MAFSEKVKRTVREKAFFRCVICHEPFVEIHHILPLAEGGTDDEDNAAPLCARCHDIYGDSPMRRRQIRQMRDHWYALMAERRCSIATAAELKLLGGGSPLYPTRADMVALYHVVLASEGFDETAHTLFQLVQSAESRAPGSPRALYLDIEGHRNAAGGFDRPMYELQCRYVRDFLFPYLTEAHMPLIRVRNHHQRNGLPASPAFHDVTALI